MDSSISAIAPGYLWFKVMQSVNEYFCNLSRETNSKINDACLVSIAERGFKESKYVKLSPPTYHALRVYSSFTDTPSNSVSDFMRPHQEDIAYD